ncbi:MAG TPA: hypothetical protein VFI02_01875 [Armatimonadota bacterium]|nr:hypothetical protein [Armatimonadota bacterium]
MAKRRKSKQTVEEASKPKKVHEPKLTRAGYQITFWVVVLGFVAQVVMAIMVYPHLPAQIPARWAGFLFEGQTIPSWIVFVLFPVGEIVLLLVTIFSPRDDQGKLVMESGKAWTLILLALFFTLLQYSAFLL